MEQMPEIKTEIDHKSLADCLEYARKIGVFLSNLNLMSCFLHCFLLKR
jgi:hypothetical protein